MYSNSFLLSEDNLPQFTIKLPNILDNMLSPLKYKTVRVPEQKKVNERCYSTCFALNGNQLRTITAKLVLGPAIGSGNRWGNYYIAIRHYKLLICIWKPCIIFVCCHGTSFPRNGRHPVVMCGSGCFRRYDNQDCTPCSVFNEREPSPRESSCPLP